jgi:peptide deformylase
VAKSKARIRRRAEAAVADDPELAARREDAERELRKQYAFAQVRQYPDPVLRMRAYAVEEFGDDLQRIVARMAQLMQAAHGVGLAAPQVGILQRVVVYQADPDVDGFTALVNPSIVERTDETDVGEEGCLSLGRASVQVDVERALGIWVEAQTPLGEPIRLEAEELEARVIQHELDHLDGVLIIDRTTREQRKRALGELRPRPELGAPDQS